MTPALLLSAANALAPVHDEPTSVRLTRLAHVAIATSEVPMAADVLAVMIAETGLSPGAHRGELRGDNGRSWCVAQINEGNRLGGKHALLVGTDLESTRRCARAASRTLVYGRGWCRKHAPDVPERFAAMSHYATGSRCEWSGAGGRVALADRIAGWRRQPGEHGLRALRRALEPKPCTGVVLVRSGQWLVVRVDQGCDEKRLSLLEAGERP